VSSHRRHRDIRVIALGTGLLLMLDLVAWLGWFAWHLLPVLIPAAVLVYACRRWKLHRRGLAWLRIGNAPRARPNIAVGQVVDDRELDRLRTQIARLECAANRPIDAVIASYEVIRSRYGDAGVGDTRGSQ
jgi:hypothetical protein